MSAAAGPGRPRVAAVVVTYHSEPVIEACLDALLADGVDRIVVVDNDSGDDTVAVCRRRLPADDVIDHGRNVGFGAGVNVGLAHLADDDATFVVVANPDLWFERGVVPRLVDVLEQRADVAVVGPRIVGPDGRRYPSARRFPDPVVGAGHAVIGMFRPDNRFSRRYRVDVEPASASVVDWVSGTFFVARRSMLDAVGGFDEGYFMYVEDVDLCWRLSLIGQKVAYVPEVTVTHLVGASSDRRPLRMVVAHHRSMLRFLSRSWRGPRRLLLPVVAIGLTLRAAVVAARFAVDRRSPWRAV